MSKDEQWLLEEKYGGVVTAEYEADTRRLAKGEPLAYVIGYQPFLGLKIYLDSKPLIPRPETEWWAEKLLEHIKGVRAYQLEELPQGDGPRPSKFSAENYASPKAGMPACITFLDLCAGSGAIGCAALARLPNAQVYFGEVDPAHEATMLKNIRENKLDESRAHIGIGDLFEPFGDMRFDFIATNPPYIPTGRTLEPSVTDYEPHQALFSGDDGLELIRRIANSARCHLAEEGQSWIECDSASAAAAAALFTAQGLHTEIRNDQYDTPRLLVVSFQ